MWRKCDLHIHTTPNEQAPEQPLDAVDLVRRCLDRGLSVVAITDHDHARNVEAVVAAAGDELLVVAGVEVTTDHGHLLVLAPSANGSAVIQELVSRTGISERSQRSFNEIVQIVSQEAGPTTGLFRDSVVLIGAHVDSPGSLL
jgi:histidinol phosphatase-like PHP family hydrolase